MSAVLLLILAALYLIYQKLQRWRKEFSTIPGPPGYPIIGNFFDVIQPFGKKFRQDFENSKRYYPIYKESIFHQKLIHLNHPEDLKMVMTDSNRCTKVVDIFEKWLGRGILNQNGEHWYNNRKLVMKSFNMKNIALWLESFQKELDNLISTIEENINTSLEINNYIHNYIANCIKIFTYGNDSLLDPHLYFKNTETMKTLLTNRFFKPWFKNDFVYYHLTAQGRQVKEASSIINKHTTKAIKDGFEKSQEKEEVKTVLDFLVKAKMQRFDNDEQNIKNQLDSLLTGGFDTLGFIIPVMLMLLANHKEVQNKVVEEVYSILGDKDQAPTCDDLKKLTYMEQFIKESLRFFPSAGYLFRRVNSSFKSCTGFTIEKGSLISMNLMSLYRNPKVYPDPDKFDPDRFSPENSKNRHPYAFLPFGGGSRMCPGQRFAMLQMKLLLSTVLRKFILCPVDTVEDLDLVPQMTMHVGKSIKIKFTYRK